MADNRSGLKTMSLKTARRLIHTNRKDQRDVYQNLTHCSLEMADGMGELQNRYQVDLRSGECRGPLSFSRHSIRQLCKIAGIPHYAIEKMPAAIGLNVLRVMLEVAGSRIDRLYLFRIRENSQTRRVRAILPASYIRCDDSEVLDTVISTTGTRKARVSNLTIREDLFSLRVLLPDSLDFGTARSADAGQVGVDITTSETGYTQTQIRYLVYRLICSNGMTALARDGEADVRRSPRMDPDMFRQELGDALGRTLSHGREIEQRLVHSRHDYLDDPIAELREVFREYRLGSPKGKLGNWVTTELIREQNLMGVRRWDVVQAFTAVARNLEHKERLKVEDAMTDYVMETVST